MRDIVYLGALALLEEDDEIRITRLLRRIGNLISSFHYEINRLDLEIFMYVLHLHPGISGQSAGQHQTLVNDCLSIPVAIFAYIMDAGLIRLAR